MWTTTLQLDPWRIAMTRLLGSVWQGAYFSKVAPLRVENLPRQPLPAATWVRVRNRLSGICGSDLELISAERDLRIAPAALPGQHYYYPGREVVGEVIEVGKKVQHIRVGNRVVLQHSANCVSSGVINLCRFCATGDYNLWEFGVLPGSQPIGGGWSEEMLLPEQQLSSIPASISDDQAVMIEPTAVALHALLRCPPQAGERVLIIGAGTIGLLLLHLLRTIAPQVEIAILARHPFQAEIAQRLGATHIVDTKKSYADIQRTTQARLYSGHFGNRLLIGGYDLIYDTIGKEKTLHDALRWARANATVVLVGISLRMMHIDLSPVWNQQIKLLGSTGPGNEMWPLGSRVQRTTFRIVKELLERVLIHPEHLITHYFSLNDYQDALTTALNKTSSRAVKVVFDHALLSATVVAPNRTALGTKPLITSQGPRRAI